MAPRRRVRNLPILLGLVASIAVHGTVLWPLLVGVMRADVRRPLAVMARFEPNRFEPPSEESVPLGLDAPNPSSLTWVGYETYRQHMAQLSETQQAAFTTTPQGVEQPVSGHAASAEPVAAAAEQTPRDAPGPLPEPVEAPPAEPKEQPPEEPSPQEPAPAGTEGEPGDVADQESDATSDVPWDKISLGRPLAAQGLVLKPRKPEFTVWIRFSSAPVNPLVTIRFGRDGVPVKAQVDRSSGDPRVDEAILNSLYRWRAAGAKLEELGEGETCKVSLRIVMSRR